MEKRNSLASLITELSKFGTLSFGQFKSEYSNDIFNCEYIVNENYYHEADITALRQINPDYHGFCIIAAMCFDSGFSPIFDTYISKI